MGIPFTRYHLPNGRQTKEEAIVTPEIEALAKGLTAAGFVFEVEVLQTGHVSMTCHHRDDEDGNPIAMEICENAPGTVAAALEKLVREAASTARKSPTPAQPSAERE